MKRPKKGIIDADSLIHIIAHRHWSQGNYDDDLSVRNNVQTFLNVIRKQAGCDEYMIVFQDVGFKNYRKEILPEYKGHRKSNDALAKWKPIIVEELKAQGAYGLEYVESDDALALIGKKYSDDVLIICNDKDVFQIRGYHYNPFKAKMKDEDRFQYVDIGKAEYNLALQMITGDPTDMPGALCGIQLVGPKKAEKLLTDELVDGTCVQRIAEAYFQKYGVSVGMRRMALTYDMVRLISEPNEIPETHDIMDFKFTPYKHSSDLFEEPEPTNSGSLY